MSYSLPIETDRLTLRRYLESDYDDLLKLQSNPEVARFLLYGPRTPEQVKEALTGRMADVALDTDGQALTLAVIERETGRHTGEVTLFMNSVEHRTGEVGFVFNPDFHGRGYAAEASVELLRIGFEEPRLAPDHRPAGLPQHCFGRAAQAARTARGGALRAQRVPQGRVDRRAGLRDARRGVEGALITADHRSVTNSPRFDTSRHAFTATAGTTGSTVEP